MQLCENMNDELATAYKEKPGKLSASAYLICGWPLVLVAFGGAIGGGLGGLAYGLNLLIYKSKLPLLAKLVLNFLTGVAAIGIWAAIAAALHPSRN
jgi:hypothetical protein